MHITIITANEPTVISVNDRGVQYGDGFFTTAKVVNGTVEHFNEHIERLSHCASRLYFDDFDLDLIKYKLMTAAKAHDLAVVKVLVTRGCGGRGYQLPTKQDTQVFIYFLEFPSNYLELAKSGIELDTLETRLGINPLLAGVKTLNRLEQVLAKREMMAKGFEEGLLQNIEGEVIESTVANLLLLHENKLFTPCLDRSGISGVYLTTVKHHCKVISKPLTLSDFYRADSVFTCNSLMGIVPVTRIDDIRYSLKVALRFLEDNLL